MQSVSLLKNEERHFGSNRYSPLPSLYPVFDDNRIRITGKELEFGAKGGRGFGKVAQS